MTSIANYESCFDSLMGTPQGKRTVCHSGSSSKRGKGGTPSSRFSGDRFIPNRAAMDLDVSNFELTRKTLELNAENTDVNASPAKEEYKKELAQTLMNANGTR